MKRIVLALLTVGALAAAPASAPADEPSANPPAAVCGAHAAVRGPLGFFAPLLANPLRCRGEAFFALQKNASPLRPLPLAWLIDLPP